MSHLRREFQTYIDPYQPFVPLEEHTTHVDKAPVEVLDHIQKIVNELELDQLQALWVLVQEKIKSRKTS